MRTHIPLGALAVAGAAAFMIPPNMALEASSKPAIPDMLTDPFSIKLFAPCQGCPYAQFNDNGFVWTEGVDNSLFLDVAVGDTLDTLELNGAQIYPPPIPLTLSRDLEAPRIPQIPSAVALKDVEKNPEKYLTHSLRLTDWSLQATTAHSLKETGEEIIKVQLSINALEGKEVDMSDVIITALKNPEVKLMVLNVELQKPQQVNKDCRSMPLLCKWKAMISGMTRPFKGKMRGNCHKSRPLNMSAAEQHKEEEAEKPDHKTHPGAHYHRHHGHHHHNRHHRVHRFLRKLAGILLSIVIPLLLGILAGMLTYTFGMLLGTFIALVWIRLRRTRYDYQPIAIEDDVEHRDSAEKGLYQDEDYVEAPPVYVEVEAKEIGRQE